MKNIQSIYKTKWFQFFSILMILSLAACRKYASEFEYHAINEISLRDTSVTAAISVKIGDTLRLNPQISQTELKEEANLEFRWTSYESGADINAPISEISKERNLKMAVGFPFALGKSYLINYRVTDKTTGISRFKQYTVTVVNDLVEGWIITEDGSDGADFSMLLPDGRVVHNLYSTINGPLKDKAIRTEMSTALIDDGVSPNRKKIYFMTENAATELDYLTLTKTYDYKSLFFTPPTVIKPTYMNWSSLSGTFIGSIINDGKLHISITGGFPGSKKWSGQLVAPEVGLNYKLAPFVANGRSALTTPITNTSAQYYQELVYDQLNKRFFAGISPITALIALPANKSTLFDMNNVGMEMLHMDAGGMTYQYNVVMKDGSNDRYFMQIRTTYSIASPSLTLVKRKMDAPDIQNMSSASTSFISQHLFYGAGNKVYRYEPSSNTTKLQYTFPGTEQVLQVRCVRPIGAAGFNIGVATWDGTQGKLYLFPIEMSGANVEGISEYSASYAGFKNIVDIQYKAR